MNKFFQKKENFNIYNLLFSILRKLEKIDEQLCTK